MPRLPPCLEKAWRTSATVRLRLSVRQSTITATPPTGVALVTDFLVGHPFEFAGRFLDRALDGVLRHVGRIGLLDGQAQARVGIGVAPAFAGRDRQLAVDPGEDLAALGVDLALAVLDIGPFTVSGHDEKSLMVT